MSLVEKVEKVEEVEKVDKVVEEGQRGPRSEAQSASGGRRRRGVLQQQPGLRCESRRRGFQGWSGRGVDAREGVQRPDRLQTSQGAHTGPALPDNEFQTCFMIFHTFLGETSNLKNYLLEAST